jgi:NTE family protein
MTSEAAAAAETLLARETLLRDVLQKEFGSMDATTWETLVPRIRWLQMAAGDTLCREGEPADTMYVVLSGRLRASRLSEGASRVVGEISRGETVGEMALLAGGVRTATVHAMRDCVLAGLDRPAFVELARFSPESVMRVAQIQMQRLQRANLPPSPFKKHLCLAVHAATDGAEAAAFAADLHREIAGRANALLATADGVPSGRGTEADERHRTALWLNEREAATDILVMACGEPGSVWTRQCLRHADLVLLLAKPGERPSVPPDLIPPGIPRTLVLLHPDGGKDPRGTAEARAVCGAGTHFHLRRNGPDDLRRLGRLLTGNANGIAFAGGGARSFAHLGVLNALKEHGIPIDLAAGTSLGAIVAAGVSLDLDLAELMRRFRIMVQSNPTRRDYLLFPRTSFLSGKKLDRLLPQLLPDMDIEDTWKDFACVSANLTHPGAHVHQTGSLLRALRATVSIPGVFPPVVLENGDLLVDGGVVNNLPADVLRDHGAGRLIACDQGGPTASGKGTDTPKAIAIIMRSVVLHSRITGRAWRTAADLYLESPVSDISLLEWDKFDLAVSRGYENAKRALENVDPSAWQ